MQNGTKNDETGYSQYVMPEINFTTFILSLNSSALVHLGQHADPTTGATAKNLPVAKQTIDVIAMLSQKTEGNLTQEEERLLTNVLYELRLLYVKETEGK
ncbi:MAG: DUF1844 domain-containing protein [Desulfobacterales bacterium]